MKDNLMKRLFSNELILMYRLYTQTLSLYHWMSSLFEIVHPLKVRIYGLIEIKPRRRPKQVLKIAIGKNCVINRGLIIQGSGSLLLNEGVNINNRNFFIVNKKKSIGKNTIISPDVAIINTDHNYKNDIPIKEQGNTPVATVLGEDIWIGRESKLLTGIRIGSGSIVAAGSVVTKSFGSRSIIRGIPAKLIKNRDAK